MGQGDVSTDNRQQKRAADTTWEQKQQRPKPQVHKEPDRVEKQPARAQKYQEPSNTDQQNGQLDADNRAGQVNSSKQGPVRATWAQPREPAAQNQEKETVPVAQPPPQEKSSTQEANQTQQDKVENEQPTRAVAFDAKQKRQQSNSEAVPFDAKQKRQQPNSAKKAAQVGEKPTDKVSKQPKQPDENANNEDVQKANRNDAIPVAAEAVEKQPPTEKTAKKQPRQAEQSQAKQRSARGKSPRNQQKKRQGAASPR